MIDYSQWGEQKFISEFFAGHRGRFLDIGAFDGLTGSNTRSLSDNGWSGVLVEASPFIFQRLVENHRGNDKMQFVNAAMMPSAGLVTFHDSGSQVATCKQDHGVSEFVRRRYAISAITPEMLAQHMGGDYDFVSLDIEGMDLPVIREMGLVLSKARLLCVEDTIPACQFSDTYYDELMSACAAHGFSKVVGRTYAGDKPANTLLTRA